MMLSSTIKFSIVKPLRCARDMLTIFSVAIYIKQIMQGSKRTDLKVKGIESIYLKIKVRGHNALMCFIGHQTHVCLIGFPRIP